MVARLFRVALALCFLPAATLGVAESGQGEPRVYTNADLEELDSIPEVSGPIGAVDGSGWEFVTAFLEREHARLEAARSHELKRRLVTLEEEQDEFDNRRMWSGFGLAYPGYPTVYGYGEPYRSGRHSRKAQGHRGSGRAHPLDARIVPLHARPSPAQVQRSLALRHSGKDAFPGRSAP